VLVLDVKKKSVVVFADLNSFMLQLFGNVAFGLGVDLKNTLGPALQ
jgi:hypothetical protein